MWTARRILKELADGDRRRRILASFWRHAEPQARATAAVQLARSMKFRDETIRKMPPDKKADLLASRIALPEYEQYGEMALMQYHTHHAAEMMGKLLDAWGITHENGAIGDDEYKTPNVDEVRSAVTSLGDAYDRRDVLLYLASAGLLMGEEWRAATWPVVDELAPQLSEAKS